MIPMATSIGSGRTPSLGRLMHSRIESVPGPEANARSGDCHAND
jgi:hypothetical protein